MCLLCHPVREKKRLDTPLKDSSLDAPGGFPYDSGASPNLPGKNGVTVVSVDLSAGVACRLGFSPCDLNLFVGIA